MAPIVKACTEINSDNPTEKSVSKWEEKVAKKSSPGMTTVFSHYFGCSTKNLT